ncbi:MAG TPA: hypothetical protein VJU77_10620 [Chthoniobacterales bacterium]|nr:hypothetical protein [Chthoniobacterales bacterium]
MKNFTGFAILFLTTVSLHGQAVTLPTQSEYEELPELKASEILRDTILNGPNHKVREEVTTQSGANHFTIDSHFGIFTAEGNAMLVRRVDEINAIARLSEVSKTDEFTESLKKAAMKPVNTAKALVTDPVKTLSAVPKGLKKFMNRAGDTVKSIGKKKDSEDGDANRMQDMIGFTNAKRKVAISLGVDPYSTNDVLQKQLDDIAWANFAGGLVFSVGTMPIGGGVGMALTATQVTGNFESILREKSPADLKAMNRKILQGLGASSEDTERFLKNSAFSPSAQTAFVLNLQALDGVANRGAFVRLAGTISSSEPDAIFCVQTAALMGNLHKGEKPLARIELLGDFPICIAKDGTTVVAMQWDYAAYTPMADKFSRDLEEFTKDKGNKRLIALSGTISPRLRQELEARGDTVQDKLAPGPLK